MESVMKEVPITGKDGKAAVWVFEEAKVMGLGGLRLQATVQIPTPKSAKVTDNPVLKSGDRVVLYFKPMMKYWAGIVQMVASEVEMFEE
jgi:hypothetical protein